MSRADELRHLEQELFVLIRRARRIIGERARAVHPDLQPASYLMLSYLVQSGRQRSSGLAEIFGIDKGAISRQVQHLSDLGLLERTPDPDDGRAVLLSASKDGVRRMGDVDKSRRAWLNDRLEGWSEKDLRSFVSGLASYNAALD